MKSQRKICHLDGSQDLFVETKEHISMATHDLWFDAMRGNDWHKVVPQILSAWKLTSVEGVELPQPSAPIEMAQFKQLDSAVYQWFIWATCKLLNERIDIPLPIESKSPAPQRV